jgi:hypothetical protein
MGLHEPSPHKKLKTTSDSYLKYSSLGLQLFAAIGIFGWAGYKLDQYLNLKFPAFMLFFSFAAFGGMMYKLYRSVNRDNP